MIKCINCSEQPAAVMLQIWSLTDDGAPEELQDEEALCQDCSKDRVRFSDDGRPLSIV